MIPSNGKNNKKLVFFNQIFTIDECKFYKDLLNKTSLNETILSSINLGYFNLSIF